MDAGGLTAKETIPASRKLGRDTAEELLASASKLLVAKGKKVRTFSVKTDDHDEMVEAMLGPTGNLRAPTMKVGKTLVVGYNDEMFESVFG
jgi:hypothetical protein